MTQQQDNFQGLSSYVYTNPLHAEIVYFISLDVWSFHMCWLFQVNMLRVMCASVFMFQIEHIQNVYYNYYNWYTTNKQINNIYT